MTSWVNIEVYSLRDGFVRLPYIKSVSRVTLTSSTGTDVYDVTRIENEEKSTETNTFYDLEVSKDGKEINYDYYQPFYQMLLAISVLNEDIQEPQGDLTIRDGRKMRRLVFLRRPGIRTPRRCHTERSADRLRAHERYSEGSGIKGSHRAE